MIFALASARPLFNAAAPAVQIERKYLSAFRQAFLRQFEGKTEHQFAVAVAYLTTSYRNNKQMKEKIRETNTSSSPPRTDRGGNHCLSGGHRLYRRRHRIRRAAVHTRYHRPAQTSRRQRGPPPARHNDRAARCGRKASEWRCYQAVARHRQAIGPAINLALNSTALDANAVKVLGGLGEDLRHADSGLTDSKSPGTPTRLAPPATTSVCPNAAPMPSPAI